VTPWRRETEADSERIVRPLRLPVNDTDDLGRDGDIGSVRFIAEAVDSLDGGMSMETWQKLSARDDGGVIGDSDRARHRRSETAGGHPSAE
jgi:hypothetical protein